MSASGTTADSFDVEVKPIELKGRPRGISSISKKARMAVMLGLVVIGMLVIVALIAAWPSDTPAEAPAPTEGGAAEDGRRKEGEPTPANFSKAMEGVSDGQSGAVAGSTSAMPSAAVPGAAVAVPAPGPASGATQAIGGGGTTGGTAKAPGDIAFPGKGGAGFAGSGEPNSSDVGMSSERQKTMENQRDQARRASVDVSWDAIAGPKDADKAGADARARSAEALERAKLAGGGANPGPGMGMAPQPQDDQNKQGRKESFLRAAEGQADRSYLPETVRAPLSPYVIATPWSIPAAMDCGTTTDIPGALCAMVTQNVYDSATGRHLLIPQGTKCSGTYDSQVAVGQERILAVWTMLTFPDGSTLNLQGMPGADEQGMAGLDAKVDNHYGRVLGTAAAMSLFSAGLQLSQAPQQQQGANAAPTIGQTMASSLGQQLGQTGTAMAQRQLQIQPTLSRDRGYRFNIQVTRAIVFPGPYRDRRVFKGQ